MYYRRPRAALSLVLLNRRMSAVTVKTRSAYWQRATVHVQLYNIQYGNTYRPRLFV